MIPLSALFLLATSGTVIKGGSVYDGSGHTPVVEDIRIVGDRIRQIGKITPKPGDKVIDATGLAVSPGFIDAHSHADGGIFDDPDAETQVRQGITTSVVGEDGFSAVPVTDFFGKLKSQPAAINFGSFVGEGAVRAKVMGNEERKPTPEELTKMEGLIDQGMKDGALGMSTGLEYEPNRYATTEEVIDLAKVAAKHHGIYISHVRNEDNHAFESFRELVRIATEGHLPGEINHIKLGSSRVWGRAGDVMQMMKEAEANQVSITADVYPYLYWQSTIRVIISTENFSDRAQWTQGFKDIGGPAHVRLTAYSPDPTWVGKTLEEISSMTGKDPIDLAQEIIEKCYGKGNKGTESVVATAMSEDDLKTFIANPRIMFCSDGGLHGSHPRGAGSFPRVLGEYVRIQQVIPLQEAIRKMTSLPAWRFGFKDRGWVKPGYKADLVIFDPATVKDMATVADPQAKPVGLYTVLTDGVPVLLNGEITHAHPGQVLLHGH